MTNSFLDSMLEAWTSQPVQAFEAWQEGGNFWGYKLHFPDLAFQVGCFKDESLGVRYDSPCCGAPIKSNVERTHNACADCFKLARNSLVPFWTERKQSPERLEDSITAFLDNWHYDPLLATLIVEPLADRFRLIGGRALEAQSAKVESRLDLVSDLLYPIL